MSNQRTVDNSAQRLAALKQCTTLDQFVPLRASLTGGEIALKQFDRTTNTWEPLSYLELNDRIVEWRKALAGLGLTRGARVSILLNNSIDHVLADQSVLATVYNHQTSIMVHGFPFCQSFHKEYYQYFFVWDPH